VVGESKFGHTLFACAWNKHIFFCFSSDFFCSMSFINFQDRCMAFEFLPTYVFSCRNVPCARFLAHVLLR